MQKPTIAVDFDGVIHLYSKGWVQKDIYDPPVPGVKEALAKLREKYRVIIFSCRAFAGISYWGETMAGQAAEIETWLKQYQIPYDELWVKPYKPSAVCYIDDRAIPFRGDWEQTLIDVENFRSWIDPTNEELKTEIKELKSRIRELESKSEFTLEQLNAWTEKVKLESESKLSIDPKSPAGALSGLMARLRTRNSK